MEQLRFQCARCNYGTNRTNDWNKHIQSKKHKQHEPSENVITYLDVEVVKCDCGKVFTHRSNMYRHRKTCAIMHAVETNNADDTKPEPETVTKQSPQLMTAELLLQMIQQNQELKNLLIEQNTQIISNQSQFVEHQQLIANQNEKMLASNQQIVQNTSQMLSSQHQMIEHTSHMLSSNSQIASQQTTIMEYCKQPKTIKNNFNLNFFLNVQCKDALNINEFVNNIAVQIADVEAVGRLGYVDGISKIILNALQELDMYKRPIHCTDVKRETLFVKDEDKWDKDEDKQKIKRVIGKVAQKNCKALCEYLQPNMLLCDHPDFDHNMTLMRNINGGDQYTQKSNQEKIIRILSKGVAVEKSDDASA